METKHESYTRAINRVGIMLTAIAAAGIFHNPNMLYILLLLVFTRKPRIAGRTVQEQLHEVNGRLDAIATQLNQKPPAPESNYHSAN